VPSGPVRLVGQDSPYHGAVVHLDGRPHVASGRCGFISSGRWRVAGADDGFRFLALVDRDEDGGPVRHHGGCARLDVGPVRSAFVAEDEALVALGASGDRLYRRAPDGETRSEPVRVPGAGRLLWDHLVFRDESGHLVTRHAPPGENVLGDPVDHGPVDPGSFRGCRTSRVLAITAEHVERRGAHTATSTVTVVFHDGSGWAAPVTGTIDWEVPWTTPTEERDVIDRYLAVSCQGEEIAFASLVGDVVHELRCTAEGCSSARSGSLDLAPPTYFHGAAVAALGEQVLVLRTAVLGPAISVGASSLRMRLAPIDRLSSAEERVLVGGEGHGGPRLTHPYSPHLFVRGERAVALVGGDPYYAFVVGSEGEVAQLPVSDGGGEGDP